MSSSVTCANCGSSEIDTDQSRGDTYCTKCGNVIDENCIVSEVQFEEGTHGASHIIGQRHDAEGPYKLFGGISGVLGSGRESRHVTLNNAKRRIKTVCDQLRLNDHFVEMSFNFYKMSLNRRLTHGRKHIHVIAACIYITCRSEGTPHMLLDLSDVAQVNVYELGRTYLKLTSALCITIPAIDPSLYIIRFAQHLELGERSDSDGEKIRNGIISTANRLVQRMKRDWMHYGRRPSGLCGSALLVAARLNGIHCSVKDIIKIVKVCETTIRKRLFEFKETPTSDLTYDEFMTIDLEGEEDPPCFKAAKRKLKINLIDGHDTTNKEDIQNKISHLQKLIEETLEKSRKKLKNPFSKYANIVAQSSDNTEDDTVRKLIAEETVSTIEAVLKETQSDDYSYVEQLKALRPTADSLGLGKVLQRDINPIDTVDDSEAQVCEELDLNGIDDTELDGYILSPSEVTAKTNVWVKVHADYLLEMKEKEEKKLREESERKAKEAAGEIQPKKKRKTKKKIQIQANTAVEAIEMMLQEKKISNKINYEVLRNLTPCFSDKSPVKSIDNDNVRSKVLNAYESQTAKANSPLKRLTTLKNSSNISLVNLKEPLFSKLNSQETSVQKKKDKEINDIPEVKDDETDKRDNDDEEQDYDDDYGCDDNTKKDLSIHQLLQLEDGDNEMDNNYEDYEYDYE